MGLSSNNLPDSIKKCMEPRARKALGKLGLTAEEALEKAQAKSERQLHEQISALLNLRQIPFVHSRMDKPHTNKVGTPDFVFCLGKDGYGQAVAWEVKTMTGTLTRAQFDFLGKLFKCGWRTSIVRSVAQAKRELDEMQFFTR